jgi:hypothetical protein
MSTVLNMVDAPIKASRSVEGSTRFYSYEEGRGWYAITTGDDKSFGMRDARKMKAEGKIVVPSVTSIFSVLAKPALDNWKAENVARACWDMHGEGYWMSKTQDEFIDAAIATASQASRGAMTLGTDIHQAIEDCIAGKDYRADLQIYVAPVMAERARREVRWSITEKAVGSTRFGYAGRCDDHSEETRTVRDNKSRKSKGKKVPVYETDFIQIAAYGHALFGDEFFKSGHGEIWGISTSEPGVITVHDKTGPEMVEDFAAFLALNKIWQHINRFKSGGTHAL